MYKIYINGNMLSLTDSQSVKSLNKSEGKLIAPYSGKSKMLLSYIDMLEKTNRFKKIVLHHQDVNLLVNHFEQLYAVVPAAGGVVNDGNDNLLFIHRRGSWDLPKGKIDKGEKKRQAAVREVEEETGISDITIHKRIKVTRHTYKKKDGKRAIKKTYWYAMTAPNQKLIPQTEEDIVEARWVPIHEVGQLQGPIFKNIMKVFKAYKKHLTEQMNIL